MSDLVSPFFSPLTSHVFQRSAYGQASHHWMIQTQPDNTVVARSIQNAWRVSKMVVLAASRKG